MRWSVTRSLLFFLALARPLGAPAITPAVSKPPSSCEASAVFVPAGSFYVGTSFLQDYDEDERPRHLVHLSRPFCLDRTEITVAQYSECVSARACPDVRPSFSGATIPMTNVTWKEARAACTFRAGRLPTEIEWEHAARGTDDRLWPWGSWHPECDQADSMYELSGHCKGYGPSVVGSFPSGKSPYGALDMAGNVQEWVEDAYADDAYRWENPLDPKFVDASARRHVVRGGSWDYDVVHSLRVSDRDGYPAELRDPTLGFRCAYDL